MRVGLLAGVMLATTSGSAVAQAALIPEPRLEIRSTGDGILFYNQISADCVTLTHGFGRNSAWGRWRMPLARIDRGEVEEGADGVILRFRCLDGVACITGGASNATTGSTDNHSIQFGSVERARGVSLRVAGHRVACGLNRAG